MAIDRKFAILVKNDWIHIPFSESCETASTCNCFTINETTNESLRRLPRFDKHCKIEIKSPYPWQPITMPYIWSKYGNNVKLPFFTTLLHTCAMSLTEERTEKESDALTMHYVGDNDKEYPLTHSDDIQEDIMPFCLEDVSEIEERHSLTDIVGDGTREEAMSFCLKKVSMIEKTHPFKNFVYEHLGKIHGDMILWRKSGESIHRSEVPTGNYMLPSIGISGYKAKRDGHSSNRKDDTSMLLSKVKSILVSPCGTTKNFRTDKYREFFGPIQECSDSIESVLVSEDVSHGVKVSLYYEKGGPCKGTINRFCLLVLSLIGCLSCPLPIMKSMIDLDATLLPRGDVVFVQTGSNPSVSLPSILSMVQHNMGGLSVMRSRTKVPNLIEVLVRNTPNGHPTCFMKRLLGHLLDESHLIDDHPYTQNEILNCYFAIFAMSLEPVFSTHASSVDNVVQNSDIASQTKISELCSKTSSKRRRHLKDSGKTGHHVLVNVIGKVVIKEARDWLSS